MTQLPIESFLAANGLFKCLATSSLSQPPRAPRVLRKEPQPTCAETWIQLPTISHIPAGRGWNPTEGAADCQEPTGQATQASSSVGAFAHVPDLTDLSCPCTHHSQLTTLVLSHRTPCRSSNPHTLTPPHCALLLVVPLNPPIPTQGFQWRQQASGLQATFGPSRQESDLEAPWRNSRLYSGKANVQVAVQSKNVDGQLVVPVRPDVARYVSQFLHAWWHMLLIQAVCRHITGPPASEFPDIMH